MTNTMWAFTEISQFQFIQKEQKTYLIRLNMWNSVFDYEKLLIHKLKEYLGDDADISIEYVHEMPVLDSGKRRYIIEDILLTSTTRSKNVQFYSIDKT